MTFGVIAFIVIILLSIVLHEAGHFITAKAFSMKVTEFFVGFGPRLWSFRRGETEYGIKAVPAGGYVRIIGMTEQEEIDPADQPRAFYRQASWKRLIVMAAGSATHFIIAFALFAGVFAFATQYRPTTTIGSVSPCVTDSVDSCQPDDPVSPASAAGFQAGDELVSVDGTPVDSWAEFVGMVQDSGGQRLAVVVERDGEMVTLTPTPTLRERADPDDPMETVSLGWLGVGPETEAYRLGQGEAIIEAGSSVGEAVQLTGQTLWAIPSKIPELWDAVVNDGERGLDQPVGLVGVGRLSGELVEQDAIASFVLLMAGLNVIIGVFNMLPLLPLDGGHVALLVIDRARALAYRLVGKGDPGRLDPAKLMPAAYLFLVLLVMLTVLLLVADIVNPVQLPS